MDTLAGYGSDEDSSSSSASSHDEVGAVDTGTGTGTATTSLGALVPDDSDDEDNTDLDPPQKKQRTGETLASQEQQQQLLPDPPLSDQSMIHWAVDYSARYRRPLRTSPANEPSTASSAQQQKLAEKLHALRNSSSSSSQTSWADHLRSQHDFHNPRFFHNVVNHFGIQEPLACHSYKAVFDLYEYNLVRAEEQARIRQQQQQQQQQQQGRQPGSM